MTMFRTLLLALLITLGGVAHAQTFPQLTGRVVDDAHLLGADQVQQLSDLSQQIETASSRQLVVATIPDLQGYPIEDYGYKLGRAWKIGQGGANNGIILIVAPKDRKVRIEVGYGLEPIMTDALSSTIINQTILPKFRAGDMAGGIMDGANAIAEQMKLPQEAAEQRAQQVVAQQKKDDDGGIPVTAIFWIIIFIFFFVIPAIRGRHGRRYGGGGLGNAILWGALMNSGSRGGGSSWGDGGGSSWGGGGGGFSGGGGSFGGGGASGGW